MSVECRAPLVLLLWLLPVEAAYPEPLDLGSPQPRSVLAQFEVSPRERPDPLDAVYTDPFHASLATSAQYSKTSWPRSRPSRTNPRVAT